MTALSNLRWRGAFLAAAGAVALATGGLFALRAGTSTGAESPDLRVLSMPPVVDLPPMVAKHAAASGTVDAATLRLALERDGRVLYVGEARGGDAVCLEVYTPSSPDLAGTCGSRGALPDHIIYVGTIDRGGAVPESQPHTDRTSVYAIVSNDVTSVSGGGKTAAAVNNVISIADIPIPRYLDVSRANGSHFDVDLGPLQRLPVPPPATG